MAGIVKVLLALVVALATYTIVFNYTEIGFDPKYLEGKRVVITGASMGIGEEMAYQLAKMKAKIVLVARSKDKLERITKKCLELGATEAHYLSFDMGSKDESTFQKLIDDSVRLLNTKTPSNAGLDMVILNHLTAGTELIFDSWPDTLRSKGLNWLVDQYYVNTFSYFALSNFALPYLEAGSGHLVVVSSASGMVGLPKSVGYCSEKHALHGYFNALRNNMVINKKKTSVTVCPLGAIATEQLLTHGRDVIVKPEPVDNCARRIIVGGVRREHTTHFPFHLLRPAQIAMALFPTIMDIVAQNAM